MKSDPAEYKEIIKKLLEKTRQRRVQWEQSSQFGEVQYTAGPYEVFRCDLGAENSNSFSFEVGRDGSERWLSMADQAGNKIFRLTANDLPTSPEEEETSTMIEEMYDLARRQALKIEQKLALASTLLDRV
jgi:hypothetical protein